MLEFLLEKSSKPRPARNEVEEISARFVMGARPRQIVETLVHRGWPRGDAEIVVTQAYAEYTAGMADQAARRIRWGVGWLVGGLAITILTFLYRRYLGFTVAADGAILFGAISTVRGILGWIHFRSAAARFRSG